jgi:thiosulfate/3-mercaptopyruvate sulfurtransferase
VLDPVVSRAWLAEHRADVVLADVRRDLEVPGADAFAEGHLPGAVLVDLDRWLAGEASQEHGRHPLPAPERFAEGMSLAGIGDDTTVVAYDDAGGVIAARLVWMLRALGRDAALLDGALTGDDPVEHGPVAAVPAVFTPRPWPAELLAQADDALDGRNVVLDARPRERFDGAPDPLDPARVTCPAPAACRAARAWPRTGCCCRPTCCGRAWPRSASPARSRWWPTAAPASPPATRCW